MSKFIHTIRLVTGILLLIGFIICSTLIIIGWDLVKNDATLILSSIAILIISGYGSYSVLFFKD